MSVFPVTGGVTESWIIRSVEPVTSALVGSFSSVTTPDGPAGCRKVAR